MEGLSNELIMKILEDTAKMRSDVAVIMKDTSRISAIEEQTRKTNGRVNRLEDWKEETDKKLLNMSKTTIISNPKKVEVKADIDMVKQFFEKGLVIAGIVSSAVVIIWKIIAEIISKV